MLELHHTGIPRIQQVRTSRRSESRDCYRTKPTKKRAGGFFWSWKDRWGDVWGGV